jgi:formate dehydrogenase iron-sulfur subunit
LHNAGRSEAYLYGTPNTPGATGGLEHLHAFFLLTAAPEVYNLPHSPTRPANRTMPGFLSGLATMAALAAFAVAALRR